MPFPFATHPISSTFRLLVCVLPQFVATNLKVLFNISGTMQAPVTNVSLLGLGVRDSAYTYLDPHGVPSGGDWALQVPPLGDCGNWGCSLPPSFLPLQSFHFVCVCMFVAVQRSGAVFLQGTEGPCELHACPRLCGCRCGSLVRCVYGVRPGPTKVG
jgi:hypothetical protein